MYKLQHNYPSEFDNTIVVIHNMGSSEIATIMCYDNTTLLDIYSRSLVVSCQDGEDQYVPMVSWLWEPLAYPLFFPSGILGWGLVGSIENPAEGYTGMDFKAPATQIWHYWAYLHEPQFQLFGRLMNKYNIDMFTWELKCHLQYIHSNQECPKSMETGWLSITIRAEFRIDLNTGGLQEVFLKWIFSWSPLSVAQEQCTSVIPHPMEHLLEQVWAEGDYERLLATALIVTIFTFGHLAHFLRAEGQRRHRLYLCWPELVPNPRVGLPWQLLYQSQLDRAFLTTMGVNTWLFQVILDVEFENQWNLAPIPQTDTNINGEPRIGTRSLDAAGSLGLFLHYLRSSMWEVGLQLISELIPSTVNRYLAFARQILLSTLRGYSASRITWFDDEKLEEMTNLIQVTISTLPCNIQAHCFL